MLKAEYTPYRLQFRKAARTSRAVMNCKDTYYIRIHDTDFPGRSGLGEVALFKGLSDEDNESFEKILADCCRNIDSLQITDMPCSSIRFGIETALSDLRNGGVMKPFSLSGDFSIPINGLVWMGDFPTMLDEMKCKLDMGFQCIKLKIGGIEFDDEIELLKKLRENFSSDDIEIRVDANGAFKPEEALSKLDRLSKYSIHSIEQPIARYQPQAMAMICRESPIAVALDEELIGITPNECKREMLEFIRPRYIILKPSLCGGFAEAESWIATAEALGIDWWATSALESNVGLNAIARWVTRYEPTRPQGLGTGALYTNNIPSPLEMHGDRLTNNGKMTWDTSKIGF